VPGEAGERLPAHGGVEAVVDPRVLLPHQNLNTHRPMRGTFRKETFLRRCHPHHDHQGDVGRPQSFEGLRPVGGPPVVEGGTGNIEPARCVNGQLPIDKILVSFTLQHWTQRERHG